MAIKICKWCGHKAQFHQDPTDPNIETRYKGKCKEPRGCDCLHGEYI